MKNKNGFTLIELLAIIVILSIIALIATPIVVRLIGKARRAAAENSAYGILKAGELYYARSLMADLGLFTEEIYINFDETATDYAEEKKKIDELDIHGDIPTKGTIRIDTLGNVTINKNDPLVINSYSCLHDEYGTGVTGYAGDTEVDPDIVDGVGIYDATKYDVHCTGGHQ